MNHKKQKIIHQEGGGKPSHGTDTSAARKGADGTVEIAGQCCGGYGTVCVADWFTVDPGSLRNALRLIEYKKK